MLKYLKEYNFWLTNRYFDDETKQELSMIKDDDKEIEDRFYRDLEFGTGGLRGIISAGTNRMNIYTVRKTSQGLANYVCRQGVHMMDRGIVIAYDSRINSTVFAKEAAKVFAANGIKAYLFDELRPTPELSFAVRHLNAAAGIIITASHNSKEYNGYKVYGSDGGQLSLEDSKIVQDEINKIIDITKINVLGENSKIANDMIKIIGKELDDAFISRIRSLSLNEELVNKISDSYKIIYTPLHGTGNKLVRRILSEIGFKNVLVVSEQELPDPLFSTVKLPNPGEKEAFTLAIELAKKENVDLIIGTDPDCDRVGVVVKDTTGEYFLLTGNQTGCLLTEYILSHKKEKGELPNNGFVVKTIVTTELARIIANHYNIELIEVLTGFKFIGEKIRELDEHGDKKFLFGFEESYGYLAGTFSRDKDGVVTSMLIAEMAAYFKASGLSLYDALIKLYEKYGYTIEQVKFYTLEGKDGVAKTLHIMESLRKQKHAQFGQSIVAYIRDYLCKERYNISNKSREKLMLPESDVLYYEMKDNSWFCIRPSGTEPKIKIYFGTSDKTQELANIRMAHLKEDVLGVIEAYMK